MRVKQIEGRWYDIGGMEERWKEWKAEDDYEIDGTKGRSLIGLKISAVTSPNNRLSRTYPRLGDGEARQTPLIIR